MSDLTNDCILEDIWEQVWEEFPDNTEEVNASIAQQRFEDLCQ
tara:strand:+ start:3566 stop:3694 length:129 start_codon:yes stop_codon:yes gene_type:complete